MPILRVRAKDLLKLNQDFIPRDAMIHMPIRHVMEYVPKRFRASVSQAMDRDAIYAFKDGMCSESILRALASQVEEIAADPLRGGPKSGLVICFVPASTQDQTIIRYTNVASRLQALTGIECPLDAIGRESDSLPGHVNGKSANPTAGFSFNPTRFKGKHVILIDDVTTSGTTIRHAAYKLWKRGARIITGLAVAKTVHPE